MMNQIIFLIDTNLEGCINDNPTSLSNAVCLSCLRLLHFLSSECEKGAPTKTSKLHHTKVKWSYKLFNSKYFVSKIENHRLYDLRLKYFEEFENEVQRRFESSVTDGKARILNSNIKAGDNLHLALMQLLADVSWENQDISSPVKGRKNRKASKPSKKNTVILFSRTPKTFAQLKEFGGKQVLDEDIFLDIILPGSLFQQFCDVTRISLYWVDTQHSKYLEDADISAVQIVEKALAKANGSLVSLDSITKHGSIHYSSVASLLEEDIGCEEQEVAKLTQGSLATRQGCNSLLPITTALSSWFKHDTLCSNDNEQPDQTTIIIGDRCIGAICRDVQIHQQATSGNRETSLSSTDHVQPVNEFSFSGRFMAYGLIDRQPLKRLTVQCSCVCEAAYDDEGLGKSGVRKDGVFERLIAKLAARNTCLVLTQVHTGHLVLLEPLSVQTGCMSLMSKWSILAVEKQLVAGEHGVASPSKLKNDGTFEHLVQRLVKNVPNNYCTSYDAGPLSLDSTDSAGSFDGRLLDRWLVPGPPKSFQSLITKLNHRVSGLDFLTEQETSMLKQLQKMYKQETKPPCLHSPSTSANTGNVGIEEKVDRFELPLKGKTSRVSLSRTEMILSKSRAVAKEQGQEKEEQGAGPDQPDRARPDTGTHITDFNSVEELKSYLTSVYKKMCSGESTLDSSVQMVVMVTQQFIKQTGMENVEEQCSSLLKESLLQTGAQLREKYSQHEDLPQEHKINEYSVQVLLRMEMMSSLENKDQQEGEGDNDEIVGLLRTVSFISGPDVLNKFMESSLLYNYIHSIPRTLTNIYDELMQPLPDALAMLLSPDTSSAGDQSTLDVSMQGADIMGGPPSARTRSHGSVGPPSSQPGSSLSMSQLDISASRPRGNRKLAHHPSLADFGAKRQIVVQKVVKEKTSKSSKKSKDPHKRSKDKVAKVLFDKRGGVKLERRQSVAVMQRSCKTPKKTPRKSPRKMLKSPQYGISPRKKLVAETPSHKLLSSVLQGREARKRHLSGTAVIEESPVKACEPALKDTPTKGKRAKALLRRSFYSAGPVKRTKNLSQYFQLADKIAGRQRQPSGHSTEANKESTRPAKLLSFDTSAHFKSPDKNSSFLLSQLAVSPSPAKATPRKVASHTPSKLVLESPSHNTRSRRAMSPAVNLFQSPSTRSRVVSPSNRSKVASPAVRQLMSPVSHRSPHVLVAESETKESPKSLQSTPVKSPICGIVISGLDSPSHNTRLSVSKTPTRNSVRAALFSKSPNVNRTQSPSQRCASPRTLLSKFGSPCKQSTKHGVLASPSKNANLFTDMFDQQAVKSGKSCVGSLKFDERAYLYGGKENETDLKVNLQKTPSPKCKKIVKTPESFDKWHRRKPRTSPAVPKSHAQNMLTLQEHTSGNNPSFGSAEFVMKQVEGTLRNKRSLIMSPKKSLESSNKRRKGSENVEPELSVRLNKKRSLLLSPSKISESPSKRIRLIENVEKLQRESSVASLRTGSQGFDTSVSCNEISQMSDASLDYFSASNDDVFLSQNSTSVPLAKINSMDHEIGCKSGYRKKRMLLYSTKTIDSPKDKNLSRVLSGEFPFSDQSDNERSESPIFGSSQKNTYTRKKSGKSLLSQKSEGFDNEEMQSLDVDSMSPKLLVKSPGNKKYSPNVSAKSLMHLIQSPLLRSPVGGEKCQETETETRETKASSGRSRRSLKMQL
ncbi:treslin-like [Dreissena polymorpha]|uniref:Treslin n=1 Tax=Dreissena polymorpha TaxID=45954 RepID=A0A9D4K404_DREPO|nr:treslin-like [Dreissena polymorpha]KAH3832571.1 hypothetical protein DPMN_105863 [Dreissena polymorpha]